jgi:hypothetical protein
MGAAALVAVAVLLYRGATRPLIDPNDYMVGLNGVIIRRAPFISSGRHRPQITWNVRDILFYPGYDTGPLTPADLAQLQAHSRR